MHSQTSLCKKSERHIEPTYADTFIYTKTIPMNRLYYLVKPRLCVSRTWGLQIIALVGTARTVVHVYMDLNVS